RVEARTHGVLAQRDRRSNPTKRSLIFQNESPPHLAAGGLRHDASRICAEKCKRRVGSISLSRSKSNEQCQHLPPKEEEIPATESQGGALIRENSRVPRNNLCRRFPRSRGASRRGGPMGRARRFAPNLPTRLLGYP